MRHPGKQFSLQGVQLAAASEKGKRKREEGEKGEEGRNEKPLSCGRKHNRDSRTKKGEDAGQALAKTDLCDLEQVPLFLRALVSFYDRFKLEIVRPLPSLQYFHSTATMIMEK